MRKRVIRLPEVAHKLGISESTVYLWVRRGEFPKPTRLGLRTSVWDEAVVDAWLERYLNGQQQASTR